MKRSRVNDILQDSDAFIRSFGHVLPPFADVSPQDLTASDLTMIKSRRMGWDITDYGQGKLEQLGLFLFTERNGDLDSLNSGSGMHYAEKIMISRKDQLSPMHRHFVKAEDPKHLLVSDYDVWLT